jgi:hypothetical protein
MKRTRRLLIEVEHRQLTVTVRRSADAVGREAGGRASGKVPATCRICGCPNLLPLGESMARCSGRQADLSLALAAGELHLASGGGELWVCERSFEMFQEAGR